MSKKITQEIDFFSVSNAGNEGVLKTSPNGQEVNVISREDWGADESYRFKDGKEDWPRSYHGTRKLVIHHTAVKKSNGETNIEKNKAEVRAIYYYHAVTQGWGDIGYNALVDASGNVYEGRYGTHDIPNRKIDDKSLTADEVMVLDTEAGHTSGYNSGSFGVAAMGDFTSFNPPVTQILGLEKVLTYVADSRGVNVQGSSDFRRYNGTWHFDLNNLIGHRNATATACPGTNLYSQIQAIKNYVDSFLPKNISGFDAKYLNDSDIEGTKIESGSLNFDWDKFQDATQYEYRLEKVFGTIGDASDSETWGIAWFPLENFSVTSERAVKIDSSELQSDSNYVFYVRALDTKNKIISTTKHVNFETGEIIIIDNESPTVPSVFSASAVSESQINLSWKASSDNIGVAGYKIYRDDSVIATTESTSYEDKNLSASTPYTYSVSAFDTSGNESAFSDSSSATTKDVDKSPPVVTIIQPSDSDYEVSGSVSISAKAEDESGIVSMNLKIDGILKATSVSGGLSYIWNTRKISFGEHTILVEAKDGAGNIGTSGMTVIKVK